MLTHYGIANDGGENGTLLIINKRTGSITEIGPIIAPSAHGSRDMSPSTSFHRT